MDRTDETKETINLQVTDSLLETAKAAGRKEHIDPNKILHEWLLQGAQEAVLQAVYDGELTYLQAAHALQITLYDLNDLIMARGSWPYTEDDHEEVLKNIQLKKKSAS